MTALVVGKKGDVKKRQFEGVHPDLLAAGEYALSIRDKKWISTGGNGYVFPGNRSHSFWGIKAGEITDVFTPQGEEYL